MKKIVGFQNKEGMVLKRNWNLYDEELLVLLGEKGIKQLIRDLKGTERDRARGFMGYTTEEIFEEMDNIIDETIAKRYSI